MAKKIMVEEVEKTSKKKESKKKKEKKLKLNKSHADEIGRLNRVSGQIQGIANMLVKERDLNDVLMQFKAAHSALRAIELRIFDTYVNQSITDIAAAEKRKERDAKIVELKNILSKS